MSYKMHNNNGWCHQYDSMMLSFSLKDACASQMEISVYRSENALPQTV